MLATIWKFVMLGLSFVSLLVGFLLLGMGSMANKYVPPFKTNCKNQLYNRIVIL